MTDADSDSTGLSRRAFLSGTTAAITAASAGCVKRVRNVAGRSRSPQLELEIKTVPADNDPFGILIANHFANHLEEVGIAASITPMSLEELHRQVLINHDFDIYIGQFPEQHAFDPDELYPFLHSVFGPEAGWQNPFGFADPTFDDLLDEQRRTDGEQRRQTVTELQESFGRIYPFVPVALPDILSAVRTDRFSNWNVRDPVGPLGILTLERNQPGITTLRLATTDSRISENWNPIAAEFRRHDSFTDLLYEPILREINDENVPWLAEAVDWEGNAAPRATVRLRPDLRWHDGEPIDANDVAFTYPFLRDTSMGGLENTVPASRYRAASSLVDDIAVLDGRTVEIGFREAAQPVAANALTVPLLPEHVWSERTDAVSIAGIEIHSETTEALVSNNENPVGSGLLQFEDNVPGTRVVFERFDDHFLAGSEAPPEIPEVYHDAPPFDQLVLEVVSSDNAAVELITSGEADGTVANLGPGTVPTIGRAAGVRLLSARSHAFYHVGFNTRSAPLNNPNFRRILARLVDKSFVVSSIFENYAIPATSPLTGTSWLPERLEWRDGDPLAPFFDDPDGDLDPEAAREAFREHGFQYNNEGHLLER
ncbi:ABC transporter substrate-binding protein [Haloferacaceae archaeon DSL9]